jgi:uncharacterized protein (TIGR03067 family)
MPHKALPLTPLALLLVAAASVYAQEGRKPDQEKRAAGPLDGAWELVETRVAGGKLVERDKVIMVNRGSESFWVDQHGPGSLVKPQKLTVGEKVAVEFVRQTDNLTIRALYELSDKDLIKFCWRDDNKTLLRPERMSPLPEKCAYHLFRRMKFETDAKTECDKELAGLWSTVSIAVDGMQIEKKDFDFTFEKHEIALYVEGDHFVVIQPQAKKGDLEMLDARLSLRPKTTERAANIKFPDDSVAQAIYSVSKDELSICWTKNGKRPDQFVTEKGDGRFLYRLKRADKGR